MDVLKQREVWFVIGSQNLYGAERKSDHAKNQDRDVIQRCGFVTHGLSRKRETKTLSRRSSQSGVVLPVPYAAERAAKIDPKNGLNLNPSSSGFSMPVCCTSTLNVRPIPSGRRRWRAA